MDGNELSYIMRRLASLQVNAGVTYSGTLT